MNFWRLPSTLTVVIFGSSAGHRIRCCQITRGYLWWFAAPFNFSVRLSRLVRDTWVAFGRITVGWTRFRRTNASTTNDGGSGQQGAHLRLERHYKFSVIVDSAILCNWRSPLIIPQAKVRVVAHFKRSALSNSQHYWLSPPLKGEWGPCWV